MLKERPANQNAQKREKKKNTHTHTQTHTEDIFSPRKAKQKQKNKKEREGTTEHSPSRLAPPDGCRMVTGQVRPVSSLLDATKLRRDSARAACSDAPSSSAATLFRKIGRKTHTGHKRFEK